MTVLPSFRPSVCSMNPREDMRMEPASPRGKAPHPARATMVIPVLQLAAESPKHTPACILEYFVSNCVCVGRGGGGGIQLHVYIPKMRRELRESTRIRTYDLATSPDICVHVILLWVA